MPDDEDTFPCMYSPSELRARFTIQEGETGQSQLPEHARLLADVMSHLPPGAAIRGLTHQAADSPHEADPIAE